ncbi:MAG: preprotein translocase subunit SecE [Anaerostipes sp.]|jgi:preprotein translocase subunit SecE|nr:preprotein translocase subunit SecE [Anaerostipes sp.]MDD3745795.1 preprotein translocase subunit SecE [Anaerostipes sp.]MDD4369928.1 preprotein translocase subunit SecE [Anaerostipes sp.]
MENTKKNSKSNWFKELKAEFGRIIWSTKETVAKETTVVVIWTIVIGIIVAILDMGFQYVIKLLVG